jgi:pyruvate/2-oxoglutarate dehydrogenase complex dihydrolipoamide acyltransferase (E2) component
MSFEFKLPDLGEGMAEVEIIDWYVSEGDTVTSDQPLVSVETDKLITDIPSPVAGRILHLRASVGDKVPVGQALVVIDAVGVPGKASSEINAESVAAATTPPRPPQTVAPAGQSRGARKDVPTVDARARVKAAPAVRKLALDVGILLDTVSGSGPNGRVTLDDVRLAAAQRPAADGAPPTTPVPPDTREALTPGSTGGHRLGDQVPMTAMRRRIAHNLVQSWTRIPQCVDFREVDASGLVDARQGIADARGGAGAPAFVAFMIKAAAATVQRHPIFNARLDEDREQIVIASEINIGVATATPDGVVVPVLFNADQKSIDEIGAEVESIAERAKTRRLTSADLQGGTFTVNNVGALRPAGHAFPTPLINWPEVAILGFGRIHDRVVPVDGVPAVRPTMLLTVTADHRLIDGADIAAFGNHLTDFIREPRLLLAGLR